MRVCVQRDDHVVGVLCFFTRSGKEQPAVLQWRWRVLHIICNGDVSPANCITVPNTRVLPVSLITGYT